MLHNYTIYSRGAQAVHSAQCAMMCSAVPCTRVRDETARHVAGEWTAPSAIGGEGERTLSERDRWSACYGIVGGAGSTQPVRTLAQCTARVQESCAPLIYRITRSLRLQTKSPSWFSGIMGHIHSVIYIKLNVAVMLTLHLLWERGCVMIS
jgi:hypothetical protein